MVDLTRIIDITITRETQAVSQAGFGTALVLGHLLSEKPDDWNEQLGYVQLGPTDYASKFASTTEVGKALAEYFAQIPRPEAAYVGFIETGETAQVALERIDDVNSDWYSVGTTSIDPVVARSVAAYVETKRKIAGLRSNDSNILVDGSEAAQPEIQTIVIPGTPDAGNFKLSFDGQTTAVIAFDASALDIDAALEALSTIGNGNVNVAADGDNFTVTFTGTLADINVPLLTLVDNTVTESGTATAITIELTQRGIPATHDIAHELNELARDRSFVFYKENADTEYPEFGWLGKILPQTPGGVNWNFKTISGISPDNIKPGEIAILETKKANWYNRRGGVNITEGGTMASGEFIDNIRGADWIDARMQEAIFFRLVNTPKIPYTNQGVEVIATEMESVLAQAVDNGILTNNPAPVVIRPDVRQLPANTRAARILPDIRFEATFAGAINKIKINGVISV